MKTTIASLLLCLTITSQAMAGNVAAGLKEAFDEFNYAVTVEGDSSDAEFYAEKMNQLKASIQELQENGLTNQELINSGLLQIKDKKVAQEAKEMLTLIDSESLQEDEAMSILNSFQVSSSSKGASWNGSTTTIVVSAIIVVIGATIVARQISKSKSNVKNNRTE